MAALNESAGWWFCSPPRAPAQVAQRRVASLFLAALVVASVHAASTAQGDGGNRAAAADAPRTQVIVLSAHNPASPPYMLTRALRALALHSPDLYEVTVVEVGPGASAAQGRLASATAAAGVHLALSASTAPLVALWDAGAVYAPDRLEVQLAALRADKVRGAGGRHEGGVAVHASVAHTTLDCPAHALLFCVRVCVRVLSCV